MTVRSLLIIILALVCGVSAAIGVNQVLSKPLVKTVETETSDVVVVGVSVSRGQMLSRENVTLQKWPKALIPAGAITSIDNAAERSALQPLIVGEPLFEAKLAPKDAGRGMAALIPTGMRAYTVQTSRVASHVAGFILPGNRVDVLLTLRSSNLNDDTGGGSTTTLLQSVEILAVGTQIDAPAENQVESKKAESVTLLVTPEQASRLDLGQTIGQLTLSLRNPDDTLQAETLPATINQIRYSQMKPFEVSSDNSAALAAMAKPFTAAVASWLLAPVDRGSQPPEPTQEDQKGKRSISRVATLRGQSWGEVRLVSGDEN